MAFECKTCGRRFKAAAHLRVHSGVHLRGGEIDTPSQKDESACIVCYDASIDTTLFPCKHSVACFRCTSKLSNCPVCRETIAARRHVEVPLEVAPPPGVSAATESAQQFLEQTKAWERELRAWHESASQEHEEICSKWVKWEEYASAKQAEWEERTVAMEDWQASAQIWSDELTLWWADMQAAITPESSYDESQGEAYDDVYNGWPTWSKLWDSASGHFYFYNNETGDSQWEEPDDYQWEESAPCSPRIMAVVMVQGAIRGHLARIRARNKNAVAQA